MTLEWWHANLGWGIVTEPRRYSPVLASQRAFQAVAETCPDAIVVGDASGLISYLNPAAERMFGFEPGGAHGEPLTVLMPQRFRAAHDAGFARFAETGDARIVGSTLELVGLRRAGGEFPIELSLSCWEAGGARFFNAIIRDLTERKQLEARLLELTRTDPLTGLPNLRAFLERLELALADASRGRRFALAMADIDHFKLINDTHGHQVGDRVLVAIAEVMRQRARKNDLVARYGGEEFVLVLADVDEPLAVHVAESFRERIASIKEPACVTASFGVCAYTEELGTADALIRAADTALYRAKRDGRDRVVAYRGER